jgi:hypothetical protein
MNNDAQQMISYMKQFESDSDCYSVNSEEVDSDYEDDVFRCMVESHTEVSRNSAIGQKYQEMAGQMKKIDPFDVCRFFQRKGKIRF